MHRGSLWAWRPGLLLAAAVAGVSVGTAEAAVYTITTLSDDAIANGNCTLREALTASASGAAIDLCVGDAAPDEIVLDEVGTYTFATGAVTLTGAEIRVRGDGDHPRTAYVIDMLDQNRFLVALGGSNVWLENLELERGFASTQVVGFNGGALVALDSDLTLRNVRVSASRAMNGGGLAFRADQAARLDLEAVELVANQASRNDASSGRTGGGLLVETNAAAIVRLVGVSFVGNSIVATEPNRSGFGGGARFSTRSSTQIELRHLRFEGNSIETTSVAIGAGFYGDLGAGDHGGGGGIVIEDIELVGNDWIDPPAATGGSAFDLTLAEGVAPIVRRMLIAGNGAAGGSYQAIVRVQTSEALVSDLLVAEGGGRGLYIDAQCAFCTVTAGNLTVTGHPGTGLSLGEGLGGATLRLENSIVFDNATTSGANLDLWLGSPDVSPENLIAIDPQFVDAGTGDYRLGPGSPAVDAGNSTFVSVGPWDVEHGARVVGAGFDLGALERGAVFADGFERDDAWAWSARVP